MQQVYHRSGWFQLHDFPLVSSLRFHRYRLQNHVNVQRFQLVTRAFFLGSPLGYREPFVCRVHEPQSRHEFCGILSSNNTTQLSTIPFSFSYIYSVAIEAGMHSCYTLDSIRSLQYFRVPIGTIDSCAHYLRGGLRDHLRRSNSHDWFRYSASWILYL